MTAELEKAKSESRAKQIARLQRSLKRLGSMRAIFLGSPGEVFVAEVLLREAARQLKPGTGGPKADPRNVVLYEVTRDDQQPDGTVTDAVLLRAADEVFGDDPKVSRNLEKLRSRRERGKAVFHLDSRGMAEMALAEIEERVAQAEAKLAAVQASTRDLNAREEAVALKDAEATRKLERNRELLTEIALKRNRP